MNFRKVISVVAVAAVAASTMAMPALAVKTTKIEAIKLDPATEETKLAQWPVNCLASAGAVNTVTIKGTASVADWCGGGGAFGFEAADGWKQVDFALDGANVTCDSATGEFTAELDFGGATAIESGEGIIQLGWWWGSGDGTMQINDILVNGTSIIGLEGTFVEPAEEEAAAEETTAVETEAVTEEVVEETVEEAVEEEVVEEEAAPADVSYLDEGTKVAEGGTCANWGQAVVMYTYNNIAEGEEAGENPFDESQLNADNAIVVTYESANAPELILQSWSGGEGWAKVPANEVYSSNGVAVFTYDYMTAMYQSEDLSTLDAVNIGDTGADLTVTGVYVVPMSAIEGGDAAEEEAVEEEEVIAIEVEVEEEAAEEEVAEEAPATAEVTVTADSTTDVAKTGNTGLAAIASVIAIAGAAAVASRKRK